MFSNDLLSFPTTAGLQKVVFRKQDLVGDNPSEFTGENEILVWPGQWWEGKVTIRKLISREQAMAWKVFLLKLRGKSGTFFLGDPLGKTPRGVGTGTPQVDGADQTGNQLDTKLWTPGTTGILKFGDWVQLGSGVDTRLYMNLTDVDSDGSGNATLDLWPEIRRNKIPADTDPLIINNAQGLFRLASNTSDLNLSAPTVYEGFSFPIREAI